MLAAANEDDYRVLFDSIEVVGSRCLEPWLTTIIGTITLHDPDRVFRTSVPTTGVP